MYFTFLSLLVSCAAPAAFLLKFDKGLPFPVLFFSPLKSQCKFVFQVEFEITHTPALLSMLLYLNIYRFVLLFGHVPPACVRADEGCSDRARGLTAAAAGMPQGIGLHLTLLNLPHKPI